MKNFQEFPVPGESDWKEEAIRLLKGAPFEKKMLTKTHEGILLQPIYFRKDLENLSFKDSLPGTAPFVRGGDTESYENRKWEFAQEIVCPDYQQFNKLVKHNLQRGQTAVNLVLDEASRLGLDPDDAAKEKVGNKGVSIASIRGLSMALEDIDLNKIPVYIHSGSSGMPYLGFYVALCDRKGIPYDQIKGAIAMDPLGELLIQGKLSQSLDWAYVSMAEMTSWCSRKAQKLGTIWIHGEYYRNGGAHAIQELAFSISTALEYMRIMQNHGLEIDQVLPHIRFSFSQGSSFFMEIAKLRAARLLWNNILEECGVDEEERNMWIHARTSLFTKTQYDPYVNMLRNTTEAFSGIIGGADSVHVAPFNEIEKPNEFSHRIAINTQTIISEEAKLNKIFDPGGGSYYIETLTDQLARSAWDLIQQVEKTGGMEKAIIAGFPQEEIKKVAEGKFKAARIRKEVAIGTNKYPNNLESRKTPIEKDDPDFYDKRFKKLEQLRKSTSHINEVKVLLKLDELLNAQPEEIAQAVIDVAEHGATVGEIIKTRCKAESPSPEVTSLPQIRKMMEFEIFRSQIEALREEKGGMKIFMATLGPIGRYMPRLDFAASFFEVGGFEVIRTTGFADPQSAAAQAIESKAEVVVICGLDDSYQSDAQKVVELVKAEKPDCILVMAGKPADQSLVERLTESGMDMFIHIKSDVLEVLYEIASRLGVEQ